VKIQIFSFGIGWSDEQDIITLISNGSVQGK